LVGCVPMCSSLIGLPHVSHLFKRVANWAREIVPFGNLNIWTMIWPPVSSSPVKTS